MLSEKSQLRQEKLYMLPLTWGLLRSQTHKRQESRKAVAQRLGEGRNGELLFNKYRVAFGKMEQF